MSIKRTIITTLVALTLVAVVAPVSAQTPTVAQLMAQLAQLQSQLATLQGGSTATVSTGTGACAGVTFTRNLTVGATGSDVKCLQSILNQSASTQVSATGAGSRGMETTTFGPKTLVAVKKFQAANGLTPANQVGPMTRAKLNAALGTTTGTTTGTTGTIITNGSVSAMLASDNPPSGALISNQATADLLHINFTGSGTVTSITLQRSGISDQNTLTNVYLFDGNTRITDGYSFNVNGQLTMNGLSIPVNGSHEISVRADVESSVYSYASSIAVALTGFNGNSTNVQGNTFMLVTGSAAGITIGTQTVAAASINAGTTQYTFWSAPVTVTTRSVLLKMANFRMTGSAPSNALGNITLYVDGVSTGKTATVITINGTNYASFDLTSAPITLTTGSHTIDMRADVQAGTNRDVTVSIQQASDLTVSDPQVGVNIATTSTLPNTAGKISISTGSVTVTVDPTFSVQTNISGGATNAVIGRFIVHSYGEDVKVSTLQVDPVLLSAVASGCTATNATTGVISSSQVCGLENVTLYFNGVQVGTQKNYTQTSTATTQASTTVANDMAAFSLGSQMIIPAGKDSTLEVRADLVTTGGYPYTSGTVEVILPYLGTGTTVNYANATGQSSQTSVSVPNATSITTSGLSIATGTLTVSKNTAYTNQSIASNTPNARIGSFIIQNSSSSEPVRLTTLRVGTGASSSATPIADGSDAVTDLANLSSLTVKSESPDANISTSPIQPTGNDTLSINDTLAPGGQVILDVYANIGTASEATEYVMTSLNVSSIGVVDNTASVTPAVGTTSGVVGLGAVAGTGVSAAYAGQVIHLQSGTLGTPTIVVSASTPSEFIASPVGGSTQNNLSQATFNFVSTSGSATINELKFYVSTSDSSGSVTDVCVTSTPSTDTTGAVHTVCQQPQSGIADLQGLSLIVPNGGYGLYQSVQVSYSGVGTGGLSSAITSAVALKYVKSQSGGTTTATDNLYVYAPTVELVGAMPTVTVPAGGSGGLTYLSSGATQLINIGQVTVASSTGAIKVRTIVFNIGNSGFSSTSNATGTATAFVANPALYVNNSALSNVTCTSAGAPTSTVTCTFSGGYAGNDYPVTASSPVTFQLYGAINAANTGTSVATVSSTVAQSGFVWDDTATSGSTGTGLGAVTAPAFIPSWPTGAYTIHQ